MIIKTPVTTNYFSAPNHIAQDNTLSDRAARIITYAASLPTNWRIIPAQLMKYFGWGRDSTYKALRELCAKGYATLKRGKQFAEWIIYTTPQIPESLKAPPSVAPKNPDFKNSCQTDALQSNKDLQKTENYNNPPTVPEPIPAPAKQDVVVQNGSIDEKDSHQTRTEHSNTRIGHGETIGGIVLSKDDCPSVAGGVDGIGINNIPDIAERHQKVARQALEQLTKEEADAVTTALTLAMSKGTVQNPIGYLMQLIKATKNGSFTPVAPAQGALTMTAGERIAKEKKRAAEAATRGKMDNETYFAWLAREYGNKSEKQPGGRSIKALLGWN